MQENLRLAKDRYTLYSDLAGEMIAAYIKEYQPVKWLFEGPKSGGHITERTRWLMFALVINTSDNFYNSLRNK